LNDVDDRDLPDFADARLRVLEAPFQNFYARYATYRVALNSWRQGRVTVAVAQADASADRER
ncbi:hypothetical protein AAEH73_21650, partial [Shewanella algae]|uniref:hypothetical protein n=1 Tax=Shewanella algae TaxID=38313 RepID=UPI00313ECF40